MDRAYGRRDWTYEKELGSCIVEYSLSYLYLAYLPVCMPVYLAGLISLVSVECLPFQMDA